MSGQHAKFLSYINQKLGRFEFPDGFTTPAIISGNAELTVGAIVPVVQSNGIYQALNRWVIEESPLVPGDTPPMATFYTLYSIQNPDTVDFFLFGTESQQIYSIGKTQFGPFDRSD